MKFQHLLSVNRFLIIQLISLSLSGQVTALTYTIHRILLNLFNVRKNVKESIGKITFFTDPDIHEVEIDQTIR